VKLLTALSNPPRVMSRLDQVERLVEELLPAFLASE
jgi:hypothetical protein